MTAESNPAAPTATYADPFFADFPKRYRCVDTIQHIDILELRNDVQPAAPK